MKETLENALNGIDGKSLVTEEIEDFIDSVKKDNIPSVWLDNAYPTMEDLPGYLDDLLERVDFLQKWHKEGPPTSFWVTALFEPGDFLIAIMYIHAMETGLAFHELTMECRFDRFGSPKRHHNH
jgi:dynein heavy chain